MNTPKSGREQRLTRAHTPRMSDRKKQLFGKPNEDDDISKDLMPLSRANSLIRSESSNNMPLIMTPNHMLIQNMNNNNNNDILFNTTPTRRSARILSNELKMTSTTNKLQIFNNDGKENQPLEMKNVEHLSNTQIEVETEELQRIFNSSCNVSEAPATIKTSTAIQSDNNNNNNNSYNKKTLAQGHKRPHNATLMPDDSPRCAKMSRDSLLIEPTYISTKSFYSRSNSQLSPPSTPRRIRGRSLPPMSVSRVVTRQRRTPQVQRINKGVHHKVRRTLDATRNKHMSTVSVDRIISTIRNDRLRQLVMDKREERAKIEEVHNILRNVQNPIEMAKPLSVLGEIDVSSPSFNNFMTTPRTTRKPGAIFKMPRTITKIKNNNNSERKNNELSTAAFDDDDDDKNNGMQMECDFSDCEFGSSDENSDVESDILEINHHNYCKQQKEEAAEDEMRENLPKRKFFKTGHNVNTKKEIQLFDNIKASVYKGKISLITKPKKIKRYKLSTSNNISFSQEQATVAAILANLDDMSFVEKQKTDITTMATTLTLTPSSTSSASSSFSSSLTTNVENPPKTTTIMELNKNLPNSNNNNNNYDRQLRLYEHFKSLLPYETNDPELIEQQETLLYFLYSNKICTEENFNIFIAELDKHKKEAARIVEQVVSNMHDNELLGEIGVQQNTQSQRELTKTPDLMLSTKDPTPPDSPIIGLQNDNAKKMYPVFYAEHRQQQFKNMHIIENNTRRQSSRIWRGGDGKDQRQIDAGQREFGARECKQCGLVYSMHEPEEEKLHSEFHEKQHVLRFKGWIDEDVVATYAQWSNDGRILRITESAPVKRRERLKEILALVDMELGFSSYIMPKIFVAFLAVRRQQIVGVCLAQPLTKANKYFCSNGIDCCSIEEYDAKCGISRIWVSPLHRRFHIATKLLEAAQKNIIPHEEITRDKIAFSAPTQQGRLFAQRFTGLEDFLVYQ